MADLTEDQRQLVELYARESNATRVAKLLGVHRSTIYKRLDEPGVREAIEELQEQLDESRSEKVLEAQETAVDLIHEQLKEIKKRGVEGCTIQDAKALISIAKELNAMKRDLGNRKKEELKKARGSGEPVNWDEEPVADEGG